MIKPNGLYARKCELVTNEQFWVQLCIQRQLDE